MKIINLLILFLFIALVFISCKEKIEDPVRYIDATYNGFESNDVAEVIVLKCATAGCHAGNNPAGDISMENYYSLVSGAVHQQQGHMADFEGEIIIPFNSDKSLLYQMMLGNVNPLSPHDLISLTDNEKQTIKNWIDGGAKNFNGNVPFSFPSFRIYICNQSSDLISVVDGDEKVVSRLVDVSATQNIDAPHMVKEYGDFYYVTLIAAGKLLKIRKSDNQIVGEAIGIEKAGMIQITSNGAEAFISISSTSASIYNSVYVVQLSDMSIQSEISLPVTGVPHAIALTPNDSLLFVANLTKDRVSKIDARNNEFIDDIVLPTGTEPMQAAASPDGKYIYISARGTSKLLVLDIALDSIITEIDVNTMPMHIAISKDGSKIYVATMGDHMAGDHGKVEVIQKSGTTWTKAATIEDHRFAMLHGCDLTDDGKYLYVSSRNTSGMYVPKYKVTGEGTNGNVAIIDTQTLQVVKVLELEEFPSGLTVEK